MTGSLNKVCLIGNVGRPPEFRTLPDGREMVTFSLATSETWTEKGSNEKKVKTEWHRIAIFSPGLVRVVKEYVKQGAKLYIEGSLRTNKWTGADNIEKTSVEVVLQGYNSSFVMLDSVDSKGQPIATRFVADKKEPVGEPRAHQLEEEGTRFERAPELEELDDEIPF